MNTPYKHGSTNISANKLNKLLSYSYIETSDYTHITKSDFIIIFLS